MHWRTGARVPNYRCRRFLFACQQSTFAYTLIIPLDIQLYAVFLSEESNQKPSLHLPSRRTYGKERGSLSAGVFSLVYSELLADSGGKSTIVKWISRELSLQSEASFRKKLCRDPCWPSPNHTSQSCQNIYFNISVLKRQTGVIKYNYRKQT